MKKKTRPLLNELWARLGRASLAYALGVAIILVFTAPPAQEYSDWCLRRDVYSAARSGVLRAGPGPVRLRADGPALPRDQVTVLQHLPRRLGLCTRAPDGSLVYGEAGVPFGLYQLWGVGGAQLRFFWCFVLLVGGISWVVAGTTRDLEGRLLRLAQSVGDPQPLDDPSEVGQLADHLCTMKERVRQRQQALVEAQACLAQSVSARNRLLAVVSHELRSPLAALLGHCQMTLDGLEGDLPAAQREGVTRLFRLGSQVLARADRLLELCRVESGAVEPQPGEVFLSDCLEAACAQAVALGVEVVVEQPPPADLVVEGDERVLLVVLSSALLAYDGVALDWRQGRLWLTGQASGERLEQRLSPATSQRMLNQMGWRAAPDGSWLEPRAC